MALQVWLPLNGDLKNNGLKEVNITAIEATPTYVAGKIGKCYQRANVNTQLTNGLKIDDNFLTTFGTQASVAVWVKPLGTHTHYNGTILSSGNWNTKKWAFGVNQDNSKVDVLCGSYNNYIDCPVPINTWTHLVSTFNNGVCKLYKNGVYVGEKTGQAAFDSDADWTGICRESYANGYFGFNGQINDLRIYDHVLSPKEVKEISKGLILHYKLDDSYWPYYNNLYIKPRSYSSTSYCGYQLDMMNNLEEGKTYTLQFWDVNVYHSAKTAAQTGISVYWGGGSVQLLSWAGPTYFTQTSPTNYHADHLVKTFTVTSAQATHSQAVNQWLNIYNSVPGTDGTRSMSIGSWKLSEGDFIPPYSICEEDADWVPEYHQVYDCSGYGHHGDYSSSATMAGDSVRYQYCTYLPNGASDYISSHGPVGNPSDAITMNIWFKSTCTTPGSSYHELFNHATSSQYFEFAIYKSGYFRQGMVINGTRYVINGGSGLLDGKWHMLTATYNGSSIKRYIDGVIVSAMTQNITGVLTGANGKFLLGHYGPNTSYYAKEAYLSDARIYATALSDEDILQMYKTSAIVDNEQNLYAYDFIEDSTKDVTRQGTFHGTSFIEQGPIGFQYDKQVYIEPDGSQWLHIFHHNNPANARFASTNTFATGVYLDIDRWYNVEQILAAASEFEFMVKQKTTVDATETKWRWIQNINPMIATWDDVKPGTITFVTTGYSTSSQGGLYYRNGNNQRMCIANGSNGNWYGGIGVWAAYGGGIPGYPNTTVTTGYVDLYIRIHQKVQIHNDGQVKANYLYEL